MGSYDDTIAVGRVLYAGNLPIVPPDECWIPARTNPVKLSIVPIGGIHIFIGETVDSDGNPLETKVEDQCRSAWVSQVLEKQRCHFVHFLAHTAGTAPQEDGAGPEQEEAPEHNADPDQAELVGESETPVEESILGNLSPISGDTPSMESDDFVRKIREYGYSDQPEVDSAQPKQVLATIAAQGQTGSEEPTSQSDPQPSQQGSPMSRVRPQRDSSSEEILSAEEVAARAVLNTPITPGDAADLEALETTRKEMLATAKKLADTEAALKVGRADHAAWAENFDRQDREIAATLEQVKSMRAEWEVKMIYAQAEADRIVREAIPPRRIPFNTPAEHQPLETPKDNMLKAAELLQKKDEEVDINYLRTLVASAMQQQSKADTSRRLESNPDNCISTAQKDARADRRPDDESHTGSSERRRKAREHPNPIPVPSKTPPSDPRKGKDAMYSGRDKYRNPSPPPNGYPRPPRRRSPAGNTRPPGHGGIVIRDNVLPRNRNRERSPEPRRNQNNVHEPEPRRSRNEDRGPEPRRSHDPEPRRSRDPEPYRNDQGSQRQGEGSHRSRSQHQEGRGESEGGSKKSHRPPRRSPSPPPSGGGGGGGGGNGRRSRSRSKSPRHGSRDARDRLNEYRTDYIGPKCFGRMIREEPKPRMNLKLPGNLKHYDGTERPDTWIEDYYNAVTFAGGTPNIACRMLQLYLVGPARIWLSDLEKNSIFCWFDLKNAFEKHFRGTYKRPATTSDLQACIQKKGETSRNFLTRWLACRNECENVDNRTAMHAFIGGLQRGGLLRHKLTCMVNANQLTLDDMITIASDHTAADDDAGGDLAATAIPLHQQKKNRDNGSSSSHKRKNPDDQKNGGSEMVAMAFQRGGPGGGRGRGRGGGAGRGQQHTSEVTAGGSRAPQTYEEYRDMPCLAHLDPATGKSTHTNRNCKWVNDLKNDPEAGYKRARKHRPRGKGGKGKNKDKEDDSSEAMDEDDNSPDPKAGAAGKSNPFDKKSVGAYHTFLGTPTVRASKSATRILNAIVPAVPQYVRWSEIPCTFDRKDHPAIVPKECYALVVSPRIDGYDFSKCLMDGGASLNIMYLETLERMNLTKEQLKHSTTEFHGVVPGKKANSLGSITLPVAFGDVHNFREEKITFEVVPFKSSYHVIFGRPTYHKFHARACYIYNKLKIPGPKGMITVSGDYKKAHECELGEAAFAESVISGEELKGYRAAVDPTEMQTTKKQISEQKTSFKPAIETKKHDLIPGATYQRTMQRCLKDQIGRNVHAYVDDIAVMTRKGSDLISDLTETFDNLRRYKMMLNPLKCVFGVPAGKLLGFIVSHRGIEVNPEKIKAILCIKRPTCLKDVQRLTGCVAAISRFVSRLGEKALPLYKLLKKTDKFVWDDAADAALRGLKEILTSPPILAAPAESEPMLLYLAATNKVISLVIVVERKEEGHEYDVQRPVYYISEVLTESKQRYPHFQKLAYGVFLGSRKLRHYFQEHPVTVVSKAPLSTILNNADATGRTAKWGIELSAFDIAYKPRTAVKSQVLADFVADWIEAPDASLEPEPETWVMHFDGSKQHQGSGAGVTLKSPTGEELHRNLERQKSVMAAYRDEVDEIAKCFLGYEVKSTGFTPFFLIYGSEAVLPSDIIHDSPRVSAYNEGRGLSVDLIEEARNLADQRSAIYQQKLRRYHSRRVRKRSFMAGDLVLRLRQVKDHKLQSPWEGPFVVSKVLHNGSYLVDFRELRDRPANWHRKRKREDPDDIYDETDRPWNIAQLRPFYT
ncbi:hypothetical protein QYE76_060640 [Lolium multiflorum]|uniref:Gag-pol polyprotein n=1 Tax=Lolium multiflorum TaxID=4521 RepID=A0AAD8S0C6_LOLMU|nr:hypothetical protein QYE76_060640 [Lolium multiflorum]